MQKPYRLALHIFRRDLRLQDNSALQEALHLSESVIPCFIFDPRQIKSNPYKADSCLQFMAASLAELNTELNKKNSQLYCFDGIAEKMLEELLHAHPIDAVFFNRDYTPFSRARDEKMAAICKKRGVALHIHADALLHEPDTCLKPNGQPYSVYTHFYNRASSLQVAEPVENRARNYYQHRIRESHDDTLNTLLKINNPALAVKGGRKEALRLLAHIPKLGDYETDRNFPAKNATTHLSPHHKFGTISIRETHAAVANAFNRYHTLIRELYWRDFFTHVGYHFPNVFGHSFHAEYDSIPWQNNNEHFKRWCDGVTGFPIVDAGMRELKETGYMHNRVRMITASFLTKDLHIDWRLGEKHFAQYLVDYDPAVNNGNWQWSASTGCDAQPYFRIFNPWLQQKKFDPDCVYIKRFVPELASVPANSLHQLAEKPLQHQVKYPKPMIDHAKESAASKALYKYKK